MEMVIKLPDDEVIEIGTLMQAVKNGQPLPKNHGDLIDRKAILEAFKYPISLNKAQIEKIINDAPTIIEATEVRG